MRTPRTLIGFLARNAQVTPATCAVAYETSCITYGDLWDLVVRAAAALRAAGVEPGDHVVLAAARDPAFLYGYFACHLLRAVAVPHEPDIPVTKLQSIADMVGARVALGTHRTRASLIDCRWLDLAALTSDGLPRPESYIEPSPEDTADILLTSGTTGRAKGVVLTHRNILAAARNINQFIGNTAADREAIALPLSHSFGLGRVRCQVLAGGGLILTPGFQFPKQIFDAMQKWRATGLSFVPAAWALLRRLTGEKLAQFAPQLRYIEIGSAPMHRSEKERLRRLFPHTRICMHYGLTEASRSAFIEFHECEDRLDSIGKPAPNVDLRIVDEEGRELGPRQVGRIRITGEHVMRGYWNAHPNDPAPPTYLFSGDLGYRDEDGYFYLCGREDDVINVGGRKVHPTEVEQALSQHERIMDVACVGIPDPLLGEAVAACLVAKGGQGDLPSPEALVEFLRAGIEQYKVPIAFEWVESIPKNPSGKVERKTIKQLLSRPGTLNAVRG